MKLSRSMKLGSRGISHVVLPLLVVLAVAVVGTYMLVASHAQTPASSRQHSITIGKTVKTSNKDKTGALLIYSDKGVYNKARIQLANPAANNRRCGGSLANKDTSATVSLSKTQPKKVSCTAIGGDEAYYVSFAKNGKFEDNNVAVDVDAGWCTIVHADASKSHKVQEDSSGKCHSDASDNSVQKVDVSMRVLPELAKGGKSITGYVEVWAPGKDLSRAQCSGQVTVTYTSVAKTTTTKPYNLPLKWVDPAKDSHFKHPNDLHSYCVARLSASFKPDPGIVRVKADETGTTYLNPVSVSNDNNPLLVPSPSTAKKS